MDLIYCHKIVFGLIKLNFSDFFEFSSLPTRLHAYKLYKSRSANVRENFFACRVVNVWSSLPDTVCFTSLAIFKKCIRTVDFSKFLMCNDV